MPSGEAMMRKCMYSYSYRKMQAEADSAKSAEMSLDAADKSVGATPGL